MNTQQDDFKVKDKINFEPEIQLPATALTCLNGLKHGGTARTLFICGEQPQEFYSLLNEQFEIHQPENTEDGHAVKDLVLARWYLLRRQRAYIKREFELYNEASQEDSPSQSAIKELANYERYRIQAERAHQRAAKNVMNIKKEKQNNEKWREQLAVHTEKLKLERDKFDFRKEQAELKSPPPKKSSFTLNPIRFNEQNECFIFQDATITEQPDGSVTIAAEPSNEAVRGMIENAARYINPPQHVIRSFTFTNGLVPSAYVWALNGIDRSPAAAGNSPLVRVVLNMDFDRWLRMSKCE